MKKFVWTAIATVIITVPLVYGWDEIVRHFGFYDYPDWIAYGLVCICAYTGGIIGEKLSNIDWNFMRWKRVYNRRYITKELP